MTAIADVLVDRVRSQLSTTRIYPMIAPQGWETSGDYVITFQQISGIPDYSHDGASGLATVRFQFDVSSLVYQTAQQIGQELKDAFSGLQGTYGAAGRQLYISAGFVADTRGRYDERQQDADGGLYTQEIDIIVWHTEA